MPKSFLSAKTITAVIFALTLIATACGDSGDATTTTTPDTVSTSQALTPTSTAATPPSTAPTATSAPTTVAPTTIAPTSTTVAATTTTTSAGGGDALAAAAKTDAKVNAVVAAAPVGWDAFVEESTVEGGDNDVVFGPCTGPDDFDLDNLEESSFGAKSAIVADPANIGSFPGPEADIEVRVFHSSAIAEDAFGVLEKVLGTEEGRTCMGEQFLGFLGAPSGTDFTLTAEGLDIPGADVGTRLNIGFSVQGTDGFIRVDLVAARQGDTTVFAGFQAFGDGFPPDIAVSLLGAALGA